MEQPLLIGRAHFQARIGRAFPGEPRPVPAQVLAGIACEHPPVTRDRAEGGVEVAFAHEARMFERQPVGVVARLAHLGAEVDTDAADLDREPGEREQARQPAERHPAAIGRERHRQERERQQRHQVARPERAVARPVLEAGVEEEPDHPGGCGGARGE